MTITLRKTKGFPLTVEELDGNFEDLDQRFQLFEKNPEKLETPAEFFIEKNIFFIKGSKGTILAKALLPEPKLAFKGKWQSKTPYDVNDLVIHEGKLMICQTDTKSKIFKENCWTLALELPISSQLSESSTSLKIYEKENLPEPTLGMLAFMIEEEEHKLVYGTSTDWRVIQAEKF